jgi:hypothetical protein
MLKMLNDIESIAVLLALRVTASLSVAA